MRHVCRRAGVLVSIHALAAAGAGCGQSKPARFFLLTPMPASSVAASTEHGRPLRIALGPVSFPEYLDRPQIVTRAGETRLELAEFDRWAEPLKENALRVLAEDLCSLLGTEQVLLSPTRDSVPIDYRVALDVLRFDGASGARATLVARWSVSGRDGAEIVPMRRSVHEVAVPASAPGYEGLAAALSETLGRLATDIAESIRHDRQR